MRFFLFVTAVFFLPGCAALLPSSEEVAKSSWKSFDEAKTAYDKVTPGSTTSIELKTLGFDLSSSPNVRVLNYVDISNTFQFIKREELDPGVRLCLESRERCTGYEFEPREIYSKRNGNFFLDILNFKRKIKDSGWRFKTTFIVIDDVVVYKLWNGTPRIDEQRVVKNPLGPLQDVGGYVQRFIP